MVNAVKSLAKIDKATEYVTRLYLVMV